MSPSKMTRTERLAFLSRMGDSLSDLFFRSVTPICILPEGGAPITRGTGTCFRIASRSFLVTASHVADLARKEGLQLAVADAIQGARMLPLHGRLCVAEGTCDVAAWELPGDLVQQLPNRRFLSLADIDFSERVREGWFYLHGYPECWSVDRDNKNATTTGTWFTYGAMLYDGPSFDKYNSPYHILLGAPNAEHISADGRPAKLPQDFKGLSGCSIWQAFVLGHSLPHWTVEDVKITAIQTGTHENGTIVKGTRWMAVAYLLWQNYRDLRAPLAIHLTDGIIDEW